MSMETWFNKEYIMTDKVYPRYNQGECEKYNRGKKICEEFFKRPFPCFYPPQLKDICKIKCMRVDIGIKKIDRVIIFGYIIDCNSRTPVEGALIGVFIDDGGLCGLKLICHTYTGCDGYYMVSISPQYQGHTVTIMAVKNQDCGQITPCECELT